MCDIAGIIVPCFLTLANRNDPICVASPKVAKASTLHVTVAGIIAGAIALTFANRNIAQWHVPPALLVWLVLLVAAICKHSEKQALLAGTKQSCKN